MENASQAYCGTELREEGHRFILYFLRDDEYQSVRVKEIAEIDFSEVIQHLNFGGSVYITHRRKPKQNIRSRSIGSEKEFGRLNEPWHFARI